MFSEQNLPFLSALKAESNVNCDQTVKSLKNETILRSDCEPLKQLAILKLRLS